MKGILLAMLFFFGMEGMAQSESLEEQVLLAVMAVGPEGAAGNPIFGGTPMPRTPRSSRDFLCQSELNFV